jgi:multiple antibiotic resistance protein
MNIEPMQLNDFIGFLVVMLAITNPASTLGVFLGMTENKSMYERKKIALIATLTIFIVLFVITWTGTPILEMFGISLPAFEITGGLIILLRGLEMLNAKDTPTNKTAAAMEEENRNSIAIVPLALPIIAGPGAMTNVIVYSNRFPTFMNGVYLSVGVVIVTLILGAVMYYSSYIGKMIGETGIKIMTRIMGLILSAMAMSMITGGLLKIFPNWGVMVS